MTVSGDSLIKMPFLPARGFFRAAIADEGSPLDRPAAFFHKTITVSVAGMAGAAFFPAGNSPAADIAQMAGTAEGTWVRGSKINMFLEDAVLFDLLGNGGWILAEIFCNLTKRHVLIKGGLNKDPVFSGQMFRFLGIKLDIRFSFPADWKPYLSYTIINQNSCRSKF